MKGKYIKKNFTSIDQNNHVKKVIQKCHGLPLAIRIISGLLIESDDDWQKVIKEIIEKNYTTDKLKTGYTDNIFNAFTFSVDQLSEVNKKFFRSLGVFEAVDIPLKSIISLGKQLDISNNSVINIISILHQRSLLKFVDKGR